MVITPSAKTASLRLSGSLVLLGSVFVEPVNAQSSSPDTALVICFEDSSQQDLAIEIRAEVLASATAPSATLVSEPTDHCEGPNTIHIQSRTIELNVSGRRFVDGPYQPYVDTRTVSIRIAEVVHALQRGLPPPPVEVVAPNAQGQQSGEQTSQAASEASEASGASLEEPARGPRPAIWIAPATSFDTSLGSVSSRLSLQAGLRWDMGANLQLDLGIGALSTPLAKTIRPSLAGDVQLDEWCFVALMGLALGMTSGENWSLGGLARLRLGGGWIEGSGVPVAGYTGQSEVLPMAFGTLGLGSELWLYQWFGFFVEVEGGLRFVEPVIEADGRPILSLGLPIVRGTLGIAVLIQ